MTQLTGSNTPPPTFPAEISAVPIFIGYDPHEETARQVAEASIRKQWRGRLGPVLRRIGRSTLYPSYRRTSTMREDGIVYDDISNAPMTTEHAIARFFIPYLMDYRGWAVFMDGDVLVRRSLTDLIALADPDYAVQVVHHPPFLGDVASVKKSDQPQTYYARKNWSSVMLINCGHEANRALSVNVLNSWPGRDLHGFRWLNSAQVGDLPGEWNYLVHVTDPATLPADGPALVHYTLGTPLHPLHADAPYSREWWDLAETVTNVRQPIAAPPPAAVVTDDDDDEDLPAAVEH
jgi:hypothetical protein